MMSDILNVMKVAVPLLIAAVMWYPVAIYICIRSRGSKRRYKGGVLHLMVIMIADGVEPVLLIVPLVIFGISQAFSGAAQSTRMVHHATPGYEDEAANFILVINYIAGALGCVMFATVYSLVSGNIEVTTADQLADGFTATMWASLVLLVIALICTLSVKNKIVRKDGPESDE